MPDSARHVPDATAVSRVVSFRGPWLNPTWISQRALRRTVAEFASSLRADGTGRLIDVGCGPKPYRALFAVAEYVGVDVEVSGHPEALKTADVYYDGRTLPFGDASADYVLCTQVLEHAEDPDVVVTEIARVLRPGGRAILTAPLSWQEHEVPYDFRRYTRHGFRRLVESAGLTVIEERRTANASETIAQAWSVYVHRAIGADVCGWSALVALLLCFPAQVLGVVFGAILPDPGELYLDVAVLAGKPAAEGE